MEGGQQASSNRDAMERAGQAAPPLSREALRSAGDLVKQRKAKGFRSMKPAKSMKKGR